jgi:S-adenosylmethionine uptake transporter
MQALWMLAASMMFAAMNAFIKLASSTHSLGEIVFFRGFPSFVALIGWMLLTNRTLRTPNLHLHLRRNGGGMLAMWCGFYATGHLPLATATTLVYTSPLFIAVFLMFALRGKISLSLWGPVAMGFLGVLMVLRPTLTSEQMHYALLGLFAGACSAVAYMQVKLLGRAGEPEWRTVLFFSLGATLTGLIFCFMFDQANWLVALLESPAELGTMLGIGLTGAAGQLALTRAFGKGSTWLSASLQYSTILFSAVLGFFIWDSVPPTISVMGMMLIIICGISASIHTANKAKQAKPAAPTSSEVIE